MAENEPRDRPAASPPTRSFPRGWGVALALATAAVLLLGHRYHLALRDARRALADAKLESEVLTRLTFLHAPPDTLYQVGPAFRGGSYAHTADQTERYLRAGIEEVLPLCNAAVEPGWDFRAELLARPFQPSILVDPSTLPGAPILTGDVRRFMVTAGTEGPGLHLVRQTLKDFARDLKHDTAVGQYLRRRPDLFERRILPVAEALVRYPCRTYGYDLMANQVAAAALLLAAGRDSDNVHAVLTAAMEVYEPSTSDFWQAASLAKDHHLTLTPRPRPVMGSSLTAGDVNAPPPGALLRLGSVPRLFQANMPPRRTMARRPGHNQVAIIRHHRVCLEEITTPQRTRVLGGAANELRWVDEKRLAVLEIPHGWQYYSSNYSRQIALYDMDDGNLLWRRDVTSNRKSDSIKVAFDFPWTNAAQTELYLLVTFTREAILADGKDDSQPAFREGQEGYVLDLATGDRRQEREPSHEDRNSRPTTELPERLTSAGDATPEGVETARRHRQDLRELRWSPDGEHVLTLSNDLLAVWSARTGQQTAVAPLTKESHLRSGLGHALLLVGDDHCEALTLNAAGSLQRETLTLPSGLPRWGQIAGNTTLVDGSLYDLRTGKLLWRPLGLRQAMLLSPGGDLVVIRPDDDSLYRAFIYDVATGELLHHLPDVASLRLGDISPNGRKLALPGWHADAFVWEVPWPGRDRTISAHVKARCPTAWQLATAIRLAPDGKALAVGWDGWVWLYDVATERVLSKLDTLEERVHDLAFDPKGERLAVALGNGTAVIWPVPARTPTAAP